MSSITRLIPKPPSAALKQLFATTDKEELTDDVKEKMAKDVLLPPNDCKFWLEHLQTIVKVGELWRHVNWGEVLVMELLLAGKQEEVKLLVGKLAGKQEEM